MIQSTVTQTVSQQSVRPQLMVYMYKTIRVDQTLMCQPSGCIVISVGVKVGERVSAGTNWSLRRRCFVQSPLLHRRCCLSLSIVWE